MAKVTVDERGEEYFAEFVRIDGNGLVVLIFPHDQAYDLARDIAKLIDAREGR